MNIIKQVFSTTTRILLFILAAILSFLFVILIYFTVISYNPDDVESSIIYKPVKDTLINDTLNMLSWNMGYFGLNQDMDFFYDGGTKVRASHKDYTKNIIGIKKVLDSLKNHTDIFLFQEIDINAKRSYYINQIDQMSEFLENNSYTYAINYNVAYVPVPISNPMGKVIGCMATYSKYSINDAERYKLNASFIWPKSLFMLNRCLLTIRLSYNQKKVFVVNLHNTAFDEDGSIKSKELAQIKEYILQLYDNGNNYVIVGGDWNQSPPNIKKHINTQDNYYINQAISDTLFESNWEWAYANNVPSNRNIDKHYVIGETPTSTIDYFLLSPNIDIARIQCLDHKFKYSDHNPVHIQLVLK